MTKYSLQSTRKSFGKSINSNCYSRNSILECITACGNSFKAALPLVIIDGIGSDEQFIWYSKHSIRKEIREKWKIELKMTKKKLWQTKYLIYEKVDSAKIQKTTFYFHWDYIIMTVFISDVVLNELTYALKNRKTYFERKSEVASIR